MIDLPALSPQTAEQTRAGILRLVLITPARNEEAFIDKTITSVIKQTVLPIKWVIVDDGSTDATPGILEQYTSNYSWIECLRLSSRAERHFAGKAHALNAGYERVQRLQYDVIGTLDADISFDDPTYFEFLLNKFVGNPKLGVAGTPFQEEAVQYDYRFSRREHVSGACQLFRRECFESIGGYVPLKMGAIDLVAVVTARMKGWTTHTFTEKFSVHHRKMGTVNADFTRATFTSGYGDYRVGVHPLWQLFRSIYQMSRRPIFIGGFLLLAGYVWAAITRADKPVSPEFVRFRQTEQKRWLAEYLKRPFGWLR